MLWKITPEGVVKGVWWDVKEARKRLKKGIVPKEAVRRRNPLVPWHIIRAVWSSLKTLRAGGKWPAVLARAAPMTPAQGADEDGARAPPRPKGTPRPLRRGGGQGVTLPWPDFRFSRAVFTHWNQSVKDLSRPSVKGSYAT